MKLAYALPLLALSLLQVREARAIDIPSVIDLGEYKGSIYLNNSGQAVGPGFRYQDGVRKAEPVLPNDAYPFNSSYHNRPYGITYQGEPILGFSPPRIDNGPLNRDDAYGSLPYATNHQGDMVGVYKSTPYSNLRDFVERVSPYAVNQQEDIRAWRSGNLSEAEKARFYPDRYNHGIGPFFGQRINVSSAAGFNGSTLSHGQFVNTYWTAISDEKMVAGYFVKLAYTGGWPDTVVQVGANQVFVGGMLYPTLGGQDSRWASPNAINEKGQAVGESQIGDPTMIDGKLVASPIHAVLWADGKSTDLGTLPGFSSSRALGLNNVGQIVGTADILATGSSRAWIYDLGIMKDLNDLLPPSSSWVLTSATQINDSGLIAGEGLFEGTARGFLLQYSPVPEPSSILIVGMGVAFIALRARRRASRPLDL